MKNITADSLKAFVLSNDIPLISTQTKLCIPIIFRMCQKMAHGIKFDEIKVCKNLIIDGHHRYLSSLMMNIEIGKVESNTTSATWITEWNKIEFDENDWDTAIKIAHLNEMDAKYNGVEVAFLKQITGFNN